MTEKISSTSNQKYKFWLKLLEPKGLKASDTFLVSGKAWVSEMLANQTSLIEGIIYPQNKDLLDLATHHYILDRELFDKIDIFGTRAPILILKKHELKTYLPNSIPKGLRVLLPLGEPANMGSFLRNAAAFGVKEVVLLQEACSPFHPKSVRSAAGNLFSFDFFSGPSIKELNEQENQFVLDTGGTPLAELVLPKNIELIVGEEGPGIPAELRASSTAVSIPTVNEVESLNASFAASLFSYQHFLSHQDK